MHDLRNSLEAETLATLPPLARATEGEAPREVLVTPRELPERDWTGRSPRAETLAAARAVRDLLSDIRTLWPALPPWAGRRRWWRPSAPSRTWAAGGRRLGSLKPLKGTDGAEGWSLQRFQDVGRLSWATWLLHSTLIKSEH